MNTVRELAVGDVFYTATKDLRVLGPYTVVGAPADERDIREADGRLATMPADVQALTELDAIKELLYLYSLRFRFTEEEASQWARQGFAPRDVELWLSAGCWDAAMAAAFRDAGISSAAAWHVLSPIESVQCRYTAMSELIAQARKYQP
jgi:hypothetical protein